MKYIDYASKVRSDAVVAAERIAAGEVTSMESVGEAFNRIAHGLRGIDEERAAVAELIEAAKVFANDDRQHAWHPSYRPKMDALHAALARIGGAA